MFDSIRNSLSAKIVILTVILGSILILGLSAITFLNFTTHKKMLLNQGFKEANDLGDTILTGIRYPMLKGDQDIIQLHFDNFKTLSGIKLINLLDHKGIIKRSIDRNLLEQKAASSLIESALLGKESHGIEAWKKSNQKVFTAAIPIFNEKQCMGCHGNKHNVLGVLYISLDWQPILESISSAKNQSIIFSLIGLIVISILVVFVLLQALVRPILAVENGLKRLSSGELDYKLPVTRTDEIGRVSKMFNQMTDDISRLISMEKELRYAEQLKAKQIAESLSLINATLESTVNGILVVDNKGTIIKYNRNFIDIWGISEEILKKGDRAVLAEAFKQVENSNEFKRKVIKIYNQPDLASFDIIKFKDGKIVEQASKPQKIGELTVGRVWSFRDITEQKYTEDALKNKMNELERFNRFVIGRELKMKELKEQILGLKMKLKKDNKKNDSIEGA